MKKNQKVLNNNLGQATIEYVLFVLILFVSSYGMVKLFVVAWKYKFEIVSSFVGFASVFF